VYVCVSVCVKVVRGCVSEGGGRGQEAGVRAYGGRVLWEERGGEKKVGARCHSASDRFGLGSGVGIIVDGLPRSWLTVGHDCEGWRAAIIRLWWAGGVAGSSSRAWGSRHCWGGVAGSQ